MFYAVKVQHELFADGAAIMNIVPLIMLEMARARQGDEQYIPLIIDTKFPMDHVLFTVEQFYEKFIRTAFTDVFCDQHLAEALNARFDEVTKGLLVIGRKNGSGQVMLIAVDPDGKYHIITLWADGDGVHHSVEHQGITEMQALLLLAS